MTYQPRTERKPQPMKTNHTTTPILIPAVALLLLAAAFGRNFQLRNHPHGRGGGRVHVPVPGGVGLGKDHKR